MSTELKVLDLFSGIGGFSLGLERTGGFKTEAFCEIDKACQKILSQHWPETPIFEDIKFMQDCSKRFLADGDWALQTNIDLICGGFPCQDISVGGKQAGLKGSRSALWKEYKRLINEVKPKYAIIENVERLRKNGLEQVLNDLHEIGYDAEWHCIPATRVGLPHQRDRLFIISYSRSLGLYEYLRKERLLQIDKIRADKAAYSEREKRELEFSPICSILSSRHLDYVKDKYSHERASLSEVRRVTDGIPSELHEAERKLRIKQLGNSIVPHIAEAIGLSILDIEKGLI